MSPRYLLVIADRLSTSTGFIDQLKASTGLNLVFFNGRIAAFANGGCRCISVGRRGCVLGWLFSRKGHRNQLSHLSKSDAQAIVTSQGQHLLGSFWGGYVAALSGSAGVRVVRDPSGTFPCYYAEAAGRTIFASDAELLDSLRPSTGVEFSEIGRQLFRALLPAPATALRGIRELLPGFAFKTCLPEGNQEPWWIPWGHACVDDRSAAQAADALHAIVTDCVLSWASISERLLLSVSGGLDSSIIAACLSVARTDTVCLTMFTDDPSGDERCYARALCHELQLPLVERSYRLADIDIRRPLAAHLPRPRDRTQALAFERINLEVALDVGADAFMTGNGGDNVFGYSQTAAPVADSWLRHRPLSQTLTALLDVCRETGCSITDALRNAWRLVHGPPAYSVRANPLFLDRELLVSLCADELHHPWLNAPEHALPGTAAHIATILRVQHCIEADRGRFLPVLNPLVSQPIVEACLKIPSWQWRAGGVDRCVARKAFADVLPSVVLNRRVKGTPGRFAAQLLDHFRGAIRDRLLSGKLASQRILDADALEKALAKDRPVDDLQRVRILELVNVEAWIDHWAARTRPVQSIEPDINRESGDQLLLSTDPRP